MKIRTGFVSNSSTSSFICDVCGELVAERDIGISEADMFCCKNGHTVCNAHKLTPPKNTVPTNTDLTGDEEDPDESDYDEDEYETDICFCPICQMKEIDKDDVVIYLLCKSDYESIDDVKSAMKDQFKTFDELNAFLSKKRPKNG